MNKPKDENDLWREGKLPRHEGEGAVPFESAQFEALEEMELFKRKVEAGEDVKGLKARMYATLEAVFRIGDEKPQRSRPQSYLELQAEVELLRAQPRLPLGIAGLDEALGGGVLPGWTVILGAFSGCGKTSLCLRTALNFTVRGHPTLYVTAELSGVEVAARLGGVVPQGDELKTLRIWYPDGNVLDLVEVVEEWIRAGAGTSMTPVLIVDYLQKLRAPDGEQNRERQIAVVAETLQMLGRKHGILVIAAAQLNRKSQENDPQLHHLRESGVVEQVADVALLLQKRKELPMKVIVAKHRWGKSDVELEVPVDFERLEFGQAMPMMGDAAKPSDRKPPTREKVYNAAERLIKEVRRGVNKVEVAARAGCTPATAGQHLRTIVADGGLREEERPGKSTLYHLPGNVGPLVCVPSPLEGNGTHQGSDQEEGE